MVIPTIRKTPLKLTKRRGYVRQIGRVTREGFVQKFYLGHDMAVAAQRRLWIEAIYVENCRMYGHAFWSEMYLNFARQIERLGSAVYFKKKPPVELSQFESGMDYSFIQRLRDVGVPISIHGETAYARVALAADVTPENKPAVTKLHDAIMDYRKQRVESYTGGYQGGQRLDKQIEKFLDIENCWIHELSFGKIKRFVDEWRKRPLAGHKNSRRRCSKPYAENQISEFFKFLTHLEATNPDEFTCPRLTAIDRSVIKLPSDIKGNAIRNVFWEADELREVFKGAEPLTQLILGLGLNACSGAAELGRIAVDDFAFDCKHPQSKTIRYDGKHDWLITTRRKTYARSEALLWPWVSQLVQDQIAICKQHGWQYLFTEKGEPLYRDNDMYEELGLAAPNTIKPETRFAVTLQPSEAVVKVGSRSEVG